MAESNVLFVRTSESDGNNPWDDTDLILAYEVAHKKVCEELGVKPKKSEKRKHWRRGDYCRCQYSVDGVPYEAKIAKILDAENCIVKYIGYGNEEKVALVSLERSLGPKARKVQVKESEDANAMDCDSVSGSNIDGSVAESVSSSDCGKKQRRLPSHFLVADDFAVPAPPPPLAAMFQREGNASVNSDEAINAMLLSWYMSGYHTGYYEGLKKAQKTK